MTVLPRPLSCFARGLIAVFALGWTLLLAAADRDYGLAPVRIADDTWVLVGRSEDFSFANGGNIVNTAFIVTRAGVVVIDSGPSRVYGEQLKRAIARITDKPVTLVLNTHHHPDHFLGNQAFAPDTLAALPATRCGVVKSWKELGIDLPESAPSTRASMDGQVSEELTFSKWLRNKPASMQDDILGPSRGRLFRANKIELDRFVDRNGRMMTLDQLRKKNAEMFANAVM